MLDLIHKLRLSNPWKYKAPFIISWPYIFIFLAGTDPVKAIGYISLSYITLFGIAGMGYIINDWADIHTDKKAGKPNKIGELSVLARWLILLALLILAFIPWIWLPSDQLSVILLLIEILLFLFYSIPPFRLKEKGILGLVTDALYAFVVPSILASHTFYLTGSYDVNYFVMLIVVIIPWLLVTGIRGILLHQIKDFENDVNAGVDTFATKNGKSKAIGGVKILLPLEIILFAAFAGLIFRDLYLFLPIYVVFFIGRLVVEKYNQENGSLQNYQRFSYRFMDEFYLDVFPLIALAHLCMKDLYFLPIVILHLILFRNIIKSFMIQTLKRFT